jgi:hypothetical protein
LEGENSLVTGELIIGAMMAAFMGSVGVLLAQGKLRYLGAVLDNVLVPGKRNPSRRHSVRAGRHRHSWPRTLVLASAVQRRHMGAAEENPER